MEGPNFINFKMRKGGYMKRIGFIVALFIGAALIGITVLPVNSVGQPADTIQLPEPQITGGKPLMEALKDRKSQRDFSTEPLPMQTLSNLLWASWGINRPSVGLHTAPSAHNAQDIDIYVALEEGLYLYDSQQNQLHLVLAQDIRIYTAVWPQWGYVRPAPVNFVYVADTTKMPDTPMCYVDAGVIAQNAYLYCASEGLSTVVRGAIPWWLHNLMGLSNDQIITICQTFGYPEGGGGGGTDCLSCHIPHGAGVNCINCHAPHM